jgi:hypothetical protein
MGRAQPSHDLKRSRKRVIRVATIMTTGKSPVQLGDFCLGCRTPLRGEWRTSLMVATAPSVVCRYALFRLDDVTEILAAKKLTLAAILFAAGIVAAAVSKVLSNGFKSTSNLISIGEPPFENAAKRSETRVGAYFDYFSAMSDVAMFDFCSRHHPMSRPAIGMG